MPSFSIQERVQAQQISGNQDSPEGGFDGFLQSLVCTELIGWRDLSRKLLLYITDAGFHFANDGKVSDTDTHTCTLASQASITYATGLTTPSCIVHIDRKRCGVASHRSEYSFLCFGNPKMGNSVSLVVGTNSLGFY